eukprot:scaffold387036_cov162-Cyclotella_meneghiniana.AAC.1
MLRRIDNDNQHCQWVIVASATKTLPSPAKVLYNKPKQTKCACQCGLKIQTTPDGSLNLSIIPIDGVGVDIQP